MQAVERNCLLYYKLSAGVKRSDNEKCPMYLGSEMSADSPANGRKDERRYFIKRRTHSLQWFELIYFIYKHTQSVGKYICIFLYLVRSCRPKVNIVRTCSFRHPIDILEVSAELRSGELFVSGHMFYLYPQG